MRMAKVAIGIISGTGDFSKPGPWPLSAGDRGAKCRFVLTFPAIEDLWLGHVVAEEATSNFSKVDDMCDLGLVRL